MPRSSTTYTTDREHPLIYSLGFKVDKPTKEAIKSGKLPNWRDICREAIEKALAEEEEKNLKSA